MYDSNPVSIVLGGAYRIDQEPLASMNVDDELLEYLSASSTANLCKREFRGYSR